MKTILSAPFVPDASVKRANLVPTIGILSLKSSLEHSGFDVEILTEFSNYRPLYDCIKKEISPPLVGFSVNSDNVNYVSTLIAELRKHRDLSFHIVLGGPLANIYPEKMLLIGADYVLSGDCEESIVQLAKSCRDRDNSIENLSKIKGIAFYGPSGELIKNEFAIIKELDTIPQIMDEANKQGTMIRLSTSRGCYGKCTFCSESHKSRYREHSSDYVIKAIENRLQINPRSKYLSFLDDSFTLNLKRAIDICTRIKKEILAKYPDIKWYAESRIDTLADNPNLLSCMIDAGLCRLQIGAESGSQVVLNLYKKNITPQQTLFVVEEAHRLSLFSLFSNFIVGGAGETEDTFEETLSFAKKLLQAAPVIFECSSSFLTPYPHTPIGDNPSEFGLTVFDPAFLTGDSKDSVFCYSNKLGLSKTVKLKKRFDKEISEEMLRLAATAPKDRIRKHLVALRDGICTLWAMTLAKDPLLAQWSIAIQENLSAFWDINKTSIPLSRVIATRLIEPTDFITKDYITILHRKEGVKLGEFERFILLHCSGKVTIEQLISLCVNNYGDENTPSQVIADDIINFLQDLADDYLIIFQEI